MNKPGVFIPAIVLVIGFVYFYWQAALPADPVDGFHFQEFSRLPIIDRGRIKPMDTFARISLMVINDGFQTFKPELSEKEKSELASLKNKSNRSCKHCLFTWD